MARLFITPRELDLISDLTKEVIKDVIGQKIYYYPVRSDITSVHDVYEESTEKVFDPPLEIDALVEWSPGDVRTNKFGSEKYHSIEARVHAQDLNDKNLRMKMGDFMSYGSIMFEIVQVVSISKIFGQVEHVTGYKLVGKQAREGLITRVGQLGPAAQNLDTNKVTQDTFVQQRGSTTNELGETADRRELQADGKLDVPLTGPKKVSPDGISSSFYGDE
jgi:hypothetical protein